MRLDTAARTATLSTKEVVEFGVALVATGANVRRLRVDGAQLAGHPLPARARQRRRDPRRRARGRARRARRRLLHRLRGRGDADRARPALHDGDARGRAAVGALRRRRRASSSPRCCASTASSWSAATALERLEGDERVERVVCASGRELAGRHGRDGHRRDARRDARARGRARAGGDRRRAPARPTSRPPRAASGPPATCASTTRCCTAAASGSSTTRSRARRAARRRRRCSARARPYAEVPYFWTDLADWCTAEWVGLTEAPEREIVRGSSTTARSACSTWPAAGSSPRCRSAAARTSRTRAADRRRHRPRRPRGGAGRAATSRLV